MGRIFSLLTTIAGAGAVYYAYQYQGFDNLGGIVIGVSGFLVAIAGFLMFVGGKARNMANKITNI